jgi:hypothetical protein
MSAQAKVKVRRDARGKRPQFHDDPASDTLMSMVMVLASELCVTRDRLDTIERIANERKLILSSEIDSYALDQAALTEREERRQDFMDRLFYLLRKDLSELQEQDTGERYHATLDEIAKS